MSEIITVFYSLAGLGLLLWIIMVEYPTLQLEQTREKLYGLRRQLFCIGQERRMFDKRAYTMNRHVINGMIRYLDKLSFIRFIVAVYLEDEINEQKNVRAYKQELEQAYKDLPHDVISEIDSIRGRRKCKYHLLPGENLACRSGVVFYPGAFCVSIHYKQVA